VRCIALFFCCLFHRVSLVIVFKTNPSLPQTQQKQRLGVRLSPAWLRDHEAALRAALGGDDEDGNGGGIGDGDESRGALAAALRTVHAAQGYRR
jgi:hypothetical protein